MPKTNCFLTTQVQIGNVRKCLGSPQGVEDSLTSCKTGKTAAGNYFLFKIGVTDAAVYASAFVENDGGTLYGFIVPEPVTFNITGIIQPVHFFFLNRAAYAHTGRAVGKFYKSSIINPVFSDLIAISTPVESVDIAFSATAGERKEIMLYPQITASLSNQYVVMVLNWKVVIAGGNVNAGVKLAYNGATGGFIDLVY
jgi:hypothetical protein